MPSTLPDPRPHRRAYPWVECDRAPTAGVDRILTHLCRSVSLAPCCLSARNRVKPRNVRAKYNRGMGHLLLYYLARRSSCWEAIVRDALRAEDMDPELGLSDREQRRLVRHALKRPQMRSIAYYRLAKAPRRGRLANILSRCAPGLREFELRCNTVGPGLKLGHGYGSVLWAQQIGRDCTIHQHVTLGAKRSSGRSFECSLPILGNRVWIWPGAIVIGPVKIGDDAVIGAGAVVLHDVPPNTTVAGVPAHVIGKRSQAAAQT